VLFTALCQPVLFLSPSPLSLPRFFSKLSCKWEKNPKCWHHSPKRLENLVACVRSPLLLVRPFPLVELALFVPGTSLKEIRKTLSLSYFSCPSISRSKAAPFMKQMSPFHRVLEVDPSHAPSPPTSPPTYRFLCPVEKIIRKNVGFS